MSKTVQALREVKQVRETKISEELPEGNEPLSADQDQDISTDTAEKKRANFELIFFSLMSVVVVASFLMSFVALSRLKEVKGKARDSDMQFVGFFDDQKKKIGNVQKTVDLMAAENDKLFRDFEKRLKDLTKTMDKTQNDLNALNTSNLQLRSYLNDLNKTFSAEIQNLKNRH